MGLPLVDFVLQLLYALVDQSLFGEAAGAPRDVGDAVAALQEEFGPVGHVPGSQWHTRFSHFVGYGAGEPAGGQRRPWHVAPPRISLLQCCPPAVLIAVAHALLKLCWIWRRSAGRAHYSALFCALAYSVQYTNCCVMASQHIAHSAAWHGTGCG